MRRFLLILLLFWPGLAVAGPEEGAAATGPQGVGRHGAVDWQAWSPALFARAAREHKYILLDLGADWCHWCHVMDETSYRDPAVLAMIEAHYIPVHVEQDSDPELSQRYEQWGWPATIFFDAAGNEIGKRRGYQPPEFFARLLQAIVDDPSALQPGRLVEDDAPRPSALPAASRQRLTGVIDQLLDFQQGGIGDQQRFLHGDAVEYGLAAGGRYTAWAQLSLRQAGKIVDPVWGGIWQYSDALDWSSPHYEKILSSQVAALRLYAQAYAQARDPAYRETGGLIARYLSWTMQDADTGAFYVSQDADVGPALPGKVFYALDDAGRQAVGAVPKIDRHLYAREAGWGASAMLAWHDISGSTGALARAERALRWAIAERRLPDGRFGHAAAVEGEATLADTLAVGEALLGMYRATGGREWLEAAARTGRAIADQFRDPRGGYFVRPPDPAAPGVLRDPVRPVDDNVAATRLLNRLWQYTGDAAFDAAAAHSMAYLVAVAENDMFLPGVLLAAGERSHPPLHVTVVGPRDDPAARALHAAARQLPYPYQRLDWWDRREGPMANADVQYPELDRPAAFVCTDHACSLPIFEAEALGTDVKRFAGLD